VALLGRNLHSFRKIIFEIGMFDSFLEEPHILAIYQKIVRM
jgi:hypothetical protein